MAGIWVVDGMVLNRMPAVTPCPTRDTDDRHGERSRPRPWTCRSRAPVDMGDIARIG